MNLRSLRKLLSTTILWPKSIRKSFWKDFKAKLKKASLKRKAPQVQDYSAKKHKRKNKSNPPKWSLAPQPKNKNKHKKNRKHKNRENSQDGLASTSLDDPFW